MEDGLFTAIVKEKYPNLIPEIFLPLSKLLSFWATGSCFPITAKNNGSNEYAVQNGLIDYNPAQEMAGAMR